MGREEEEKGANIFHLHSPADMASQRNLSLDLQSVSSVRPMPSIELTITLTRFLLCHLGDFPSCDFHMEGMAKRVHERVASEVETI